MLDLLLREERRWDGNQSDQEREVLISWSERRLLGTLVNLLHVIPEGLFSGEVFTAELARDRMAEKSFFLLDVEVY